MPVLVLVDQATGRLRGRVTVEEGVEAHVRVRVLQRQVRILTIGLGFVLIKRMLFFALAILLQMLQVALILPNGQILEGLVHHGPLVGVRLARLTLEVHVVLL